VRKAGPRGSLIGFIAGHESRGALTRCSNPNTDRKAADTQRRALPPLIVTRKWSAPESSGAKALRQRIGNQGIQRLMGEISGSSNSGVQVRSSAIQAQLRVNPRPPARILTPEKSSPPRVSITHREIETSAQTAATSAGSARQPANASAAKRSHDHRPRRWRTR
jgi:hypothetical protein